MRSIILDTKIEVHAEISPRPGLSREEYIESLTERAEDAIRESLKESLNGTLEKVEFGTWGSVG